MQHLLGVTTRCSASAGSGPFGRQGQRDKGGGTPASGAEQAIFRLHGLIAKCPQLTVAPGRRPESQRGPPWHHVMHCMWPKGLGLWKEALGRNEDGEGRLGECDPFLVLESDRERNIVGYEENKDHIEYG